MTTQLPAINARRLIFAGLIGNTMEWYDFAVYGYFAAIIAPQFFPSSSPAVSLIAAFGAFAAGFLVRPLGGLVFGRIGDLVGRRRALVLSVMAMAFPTVLIGCLPTYERIGVLAPILIVALRIVQGLSVGGEYTSSLVFLVELAPPHRRARTAMWGVWGAAAGILLGSGIGALVAQFADAEQLSSWGWRIPFWLGAVVAITGILVRRAVHVQPITSGSRYPVRDVFTTHFGAVAKVALLNVAFGVGFYAAFVYAVTYIKSIDRLDESVALDLNTLSMAVLLLILPVTAALSDRFGRKPLVILGSALLAFGAIPFFILMDHTHPAVVLVGELGFVLAWGFLAGGLVAANVEMMPASIRCTGLAFAYNASVGWFGGTTPLIAAWLIARTGDPIAPGYWVAVAAGVSLVAAIVLMRETRFAEL
jgi:MHS family proline/betaine transporter-like MFS transporter